MKLPISVIILTYNEEKNIRESLESVYSWADEIFIVDSYSTDKTLEIAKKYTNKIYQHTFENYGRQRNWAQENLPIKNEWLFHLDADERATPGLFQELQSIFSKPIDNVNGFFVSRKTIFMGRWIRHGGHYPAYHLRIFRKSAGKCEDRKYNQHFIVQGKILKLKGNIIDTFAPNLTAMVERHNRWATLEAEELESYQGKNTGQVRVDFFGNPIERKRWLRNEIYRRLPLFLRPFLYFIYRYFVRLGFLDGIEGFVFHTLQGFWAQFLIDAKIYEYRKMGRTKQKIKR